MKRISKVLAIVLALVLVVGALPASAASGDLSLTKTKKTIFVDGCKGTTAAGKLAKYYSYASIKKIVKNFDSKTMDIKLESSDTSVVSTNDSKDRIDAVGAGKATVTVNVYNKKDNDLLFSGKVTVTVKKNATASTLLISGIKDGQSFKVNDSVKVTLTRKSGSDTDLRRLVSTGDGVKIEDAGTRKFNVTFTKAGTFTLTAESYMSEKYSGATASKSISVTVAASDKTDDKKDDDKKDDKKDNTKLSASQISADQIKISGSAITSSYNKDSVKIYYSIQDNKINYSGSVKDVTVNDNTAVVTMYSNIDQGRTYYVTVGTEEASFTSVSLDASDCVKSIKRIELKTHQATVGEDTPIEFLYYDANGIDITGYVKTYADSRVEVADINQNTTNYASVYGQNISFYEKGKAVNLKFSLVTGYSDVNYEPISVSGTGTIVGVEKQLPTIKASHMTLSGDGDSTYYKVGDKKNERICVGDYNYQLEILYEFTDGTYKTPSQLGASVTSMNQSVLMLGGTSASGGEVLLPNTTGETWIEVAVGDQKLPGFKITVSPERKAARINATFVDNRNRLNIDPLVGDEIEIEAKVYDQYDTEMKNASLYIEQTEASAKNVSVSFGSFSGGVLTIEGNKCSIIGTAAEYPVQTVVTDGTLKASANFMVKSVPYDSTKLTSYESQLVVEGKSNIDTGLVVGDQEDENTRVFVRISSGGYMLSEVAGTLLAKAPTASLKASDFVGGVAGQQRVIMTMQYQPDGGAASFITNGANIDVTDFFLEFDPVKTGSKLGKGRYIINAYIITLGDSTSTIKPLTARQIVVVDNPLVGKFVQKKETANVAGTMEQKVGEFFDFYLEGTKLDPAYISSVSYNSESNGKSAFINSVTFTLTNNPYGSFPVTIKVERLIKFTA